VKRALPIALVALAASACGSSASSQSVVARAARDTARVAGYRMTGTIAITSPITGTTTMTLAGTFNRTDQRAKITTVVQAAGHRIVIPELVSRLTVYMAASAIPNGQALTGGKRWLKLDVGHAIAAIGVSSLPATTDPTQFVDYLRAVSSEKTIKGTQVINGVPTTHYRAIVDLGRYPSLVSASQRVASRRSVKALESALGGHTLPIDAWIDVHGLVRQISLAFAECVSRSRFTYGMTLVLYDYGAQPRPAVPSPRQVYDLTPIITGALAHVKLGCKA
jgi:hypothetical protein